LDEVPPVGTLDALLAAYAALLQDTGRESAIAGDILGDARLGPIARNLMLLWYCGAWFALPDAWSLSYGSSPRDSNHVVSAMAYQAGLQWMVANAHPSGSQQPGFGSWSHEPGRSVA
jgi:hypothetical protein